MRQILRRCQRTRKAVELGEVIPIIISTFGTALKAVEKGTGRIGNWRRNCDNHNYSIVEIEQNNEKSPGDE